MTSGSTEEGPASVREEAERLVAAALAVASLAARGLGDRYAPAGDDGRVACACPFCRLLDAARDPEPDFAGRLATAVGDVAVGVAGVLRTLADPTGDGPEAPRRRTSPAAGARHGSGPDWLSALGTLGDAAGLAWRLTRPARRPARGTAGSRRAGPGADPWGDATTPDATGSGPSGDPWRAATRTPAGRSSHPGGPAPGDRSADVVDAEVVPDLRDDRGTSGR